MFDGEELKSVLNAFYEAGGKYAIISTMNEANKTVTNAVKTPTKNREPLITRPCDEMYYALSCQATLLIRI